jgi:KDO2-lipid IV(A) lauroyltransferase
MGALPEAAARRVGAGIGDLARAPLRIRREVVRRQVAHAFPGRSEAWRREVVRGCYRHFGREMAALARISRLEPGRLVRETEGTAAVEAAIRGAVSEGPGAIVVTGHLGNWELAGALLAGLGFPVTAVVKRQSEARFHRRLASLRRRLGVEPVGMAGAGREIPRALARRRVVALVADQDAGARGTFVPFLGRPASTFRGPARLALRHEVPLVFGGLVREGEGYRALCRRVHTPAARGETAAGGPGGSGRGSRAPTAGDGRDEERRLTREWVALLEGEVRARPEQYFWFHRRWKTRPDRIGRAPPG